MAKAGSGALWQAAPVSPCILVSRQVLSNRRLLFEIVSFWDALGLVEV